MSRSIRWLIAVPVLVACSARTTVSPGTPAPDIGKRFVAEHGMVSAAHPRATEAGVEMLRRGGNAIDAAVATAFTVSVGEPQMSGLGGGGGMLIWLQKERRVEYIDFYSAQRVSSWRGIAPLDSTLPNLRIVGIPGEVAGLLAAHERYGKLSRADVLAPAIRLAEEGFPVNQVLADMIVESRGKLRRFPESMQLFYRDTLPLRPGDMYRNPELAVALRRVAAEGRSGFYEGEKGSYSPGACWLGEGETNLTPEGRAVSSICFHNTAPWVGDRLPCQGKLGSLKPINQPEA
jgi:gamma-glutamyltranspeptidase/glutathione hydrolase